MQITSLESTVIVSEDFNKDMADVLKKYAGKKKFIIVDENTSKLCLPLVVNFEDLAKAEIIEIKSGEHNKSIESAQQIWSFLSLNSADRNSLVINLGGGLICDLGGFAAATFKRGIDFINIPTTLLSMVDASIGGKLGINYEGLKNEIGLFQAPKYVIIETQFLKTLDKENLLSGYAEMIKHALIYSQSHFKKVQSINFEDIDYKELTKVIAKSIFIKNDFVQNDPVEKNIRKALNFGHTFGHAFESYLIRDNRPVLHGEAVAHGMICELYLSHKKLGLDKENLNTIVEFIRKSYKKLSLPQNIFVTLYELMKHDKKNENDIINFTLISDIGELEININCTKAEVLDALNSYCEE